jgi:NAD+ diphosphatase
MNKSNFPIQVFKYCPRCGSDQIREASVRSMKCPDCGLDWYFNMAAAVAGLIFNEKDQLLMTIRAKDPGKGMLDLPGGFVDMGETAEQALRREIKEELDLEISSIEFTGSYPNQYLFSGVIYETLDFVFICKVESFEKLSAHDDVAGFIFEYPDKIDIQNIGLQSIKQIILKLQSGHE